MTNPETIERLSLAVYGTVQGVGFRPFVFRLARELELPGWVCNDLRGVLIEVEGPRRQLDAFLVRLETELPPPAAIHGMEKSYLDTRGYECFDIKKGPETGRPGALVLPDMATCPDCLQEIFDPGNRRFRYPFTNCTQCGPRFTIIESLPYDRPRTTMKAFTMCDACRREYEDPRDRRFHAQPNACPDCGPQLAWLDRLGQHQAGPGAALAGAAQAIREGRVIAVKGLGGFHLMTDARNQEAVARLRRHKHREEKPLALMYPSLEAVYEDCMIDAMEKRLLCSREAPIVLLRKRSRTGVCDEVAPGNRELGVLLPYTPLHHLLLQDLDFPVVATSGNLAEETICIGEAEAVKRLAGLADGYLVHNRPIRRHADDSMVRVVMGREQLLRRARGYAPLPLPLPVSLDGWLAVGGHLKNTVALAVNRNLFISQHIGDLETEHSYATFKTVIKDFEHLYDRIPTGVICDQHPGYRSTRYAKDTGLPVTFVQHHAAHVAAVMLENQVEAPALGVSWDGTGYGADGTIWGGEFIAVDADYQFQRIGHLQAFRLPGGEQAVREPRRTAFGILSEIMDPTALSELKFIDGWFPGPQRQLITAMLEKQINCPVTTSAGRLFDAVAALLGLVDRVHFEGQAAMRLEQAIDQTTARRPPYPITFTEYPDSGITINLAPIITGILQDQADQLPVSSIATRFHDTLVESIVRMVAHTGHQKVVLGGGCFQNRYLTEQSIRRLREQGLQVYWSQRIPPNDGSISVGQAAFRCWNRP